MIYLELLWGFLKIGFFAFGGAYGAIPLIRDVVLNYSWMSEEMFIHIVAISESTPGPIMVNLATYVGSGQAGIYGALIATIAVVLPSFAIILIIVTAMRNLLSNSTVQAVLRGIKPCFIGIVVATGLSMFAKNMLSAFQGTIDYRIPVISLVLLLLTYAYQGVRKKDISPIALILISAGLGIVFL